jgi:hypothetical protein
MAKIVYAEAVFICRHEYLAFPDHFLCYKCQHIRQELPFAQGQRKSLLFFPMSVREARAKAG